MVCKWRLKKRTFDDLPVEGFTSHCDVIVEINDQTVKTLGGNVKHSVSMNSLSLNNSGFLKEENNLFAIMKNNK